MTPPIPHIGLIGYGNVGSHLANILSTREDIRLTVYTRSAIIGDNQHPVINFTQDLNNLSRAEVIVIAVSDDAIVSVLNQLRDRISGNPVVCHTAGSVSSDVIASYFDRYGVLYPLQTFSKEKKLNYSDIPVFVTGSDSDTIGVIKKIAGYISSSTQEINDDQRISLHIAAVFTCNYTNALYTIGHRICSDHDLDFKYLIPLIEETTQKIRELLPREAQTGPAVRGDWNTIHKHEKFLAGYDQDINDIYRKLAHFINHNI